MTRSALEAWEQGRRRPSPRSWEKLCAAVQGVPPAELEERLRLFEARAERGEDLFRGGPAPSRRPVAELLLASGLAADVDLLDRARLLDAREDERERRAAERESRGLEPQEDDQDDDEDEPAEPGALLRLLRGDAAG